MIVYRICLKKHAWSLTGSGRAARWNSKGFFMVYTAGSVSLACLENLVHRSGSDISKADFALLSVEIPEDLTIATLDTAELDSRLASWSEVKNYHFTQFTGDSWIKNGEEAVLRVPSAIIQKEHNYLLNPAHPDISRIRIVHSEDFSFDRRL